MIRIDVRSLWETDDGANIYVTYGGRLIVPAAVQADFADPKRLDTLPSRATTSARTRCSKPDRRNTRG